MSRQVNLSLVAPNTGKLHTCDEQSTYSWRNPPSNIAGELSEQVTI